MVLKYKNLKIIFEHVTGNLVLLHREIFFNHDQRHLSSTFIHENTGYIFLCGNYIIKSVIKTHSAIFALTDNKQRAKLNPGFCIIVLIEFGSWL